jgi:hypothetical protein
MRTEPPVTAQLRSSSGRSSKVIKDRAQVGAVVEVAGVGTFILDVNSGGGYSLRAYPEGGEDLGKDLLAVGVVRADGIVALNPRRPPGVAGEQGEAHSERSPNV